MTPKPPGPHLEASVRVQTIYDAAAGVSVNPSVHPKHYFRSGRELINSATTYHQTGLTENAYVLYIRFLTIFLKKLRLHPNYKEVPQSERKLMTDFCNKILPLTVDLKKELLAQFEQEHLEYLEHAERLRQEAEAQRQRELEEQLRRLELEKATQRDIIHPLPVPVLPSHPSPPAPASSSVPPAVNNITYPVSDGYAPSAPFVPPPNSSKDPPSWQYDPKPVLKIQDPVVPHYGGVSLPGHPTPAVDRSKKPVRDPAPMSTGLRTLVIPADLPATFLRCAASNTKKNVETCGLLTGKSSGSKLTITDLIIPKQTGSSDTCTMLNETEIFNLQDKYNLISFGWIHTHPSQTAFLSSIDMHTHYSYQVMMPEAIAIVCAPTHNETGIFTLTPYEGMEEIGSCTLSGFHPHKPNGLFCEASHYSLDSTVQVRVHDLR